MQRYWKRVYSLTEDATLKGHKVLMESVQIEREKKLAIICFESLSNNFGTGIVRLFVQRIFKRLLLRWEKQTNFKIIF